MTLSGKETTMRRGACLLALWGMTVPSASAGEFFSAGTPPANATISATAEPSRTGATPSGPQKFTRSAAAAPQSNETLRNYYQELFGTNPPQEAGGRMSLTPRSSTADAVVSPVSGSTNSATKTLSPATAGPQRSEGASALSPVKSTAPFSQTFSSNSPSPAVQSRPGMSESTTGADGSRVVHAEFRDESQPGEQKIQQIHEERFSARPFPGAPARPTAPPVESFKGMERQEVSAIATGSSGTAAISPTAATAPAASATGSRGSVSFSRTNAATTTSRSTASAPRGTTGKMDANGSSLTQAPAVTVEWRKQSDLNVGQECLCHLIVKNAGQSSAKDMEVQAYFPESVRLINAKPAPMASDRYLGWKVEELKPGEERIIEITMVPLQRGDINTRAEVRFSGLANGHFAVAEPMLEISMEGPRQVLIGESAAQTVTVSNPGTGIASHVQIEAIIPEGLEHARGQRLQMELGNLNPGESRTVRLALAAAKGGPQHLTVNARADSGLSRATTSDVNVIAPNLTATIQGPGLRYLGRQGQFVMSVTNAGQAATDNVQVRYKVPSGFDFVSADRGAQYDSATGLVTWFVGRLEGNQNAEIKVTLLARQSGEFKHLARASSEHGAVADAEFMTTVEATPLLAVQVRDLEDPVEVGAEMGYEIRVRNEGSASAKGVTLACELADGMALVQAEGPVDFVAERNTVVFRSLPEVGAGQTMVFKVKVKVATPGSLRFRAHLSSESVSEPLTAEEMTKFYGE